MIGRVNEISLKAKQRRALLAIVSRPSEAAGLLRRARVVLLSDDGVPASEIAMRLDLSAEAIAYPAALSPFRSQRPFGPAKGGKEGPRAVSRDSRQARALGDVAPAGGPGSLDDPIAGQAIRHRRSLRGAGDRDRQGHASGL